MSSLSSIAPSSDAAQGAAATTYLRPHQRAWWLALSELMRYRDLLWLMAKRDVQVRYKQTALGALWAVIQPLGMMVVIATFLGPITGVSDPVTLYAGLLPWTFFAAAVNAISISLVNNAHLIRKVYFPRLVLPIAAAGAPLVDFTIGFVVFLGLMAWQGAVLTPMFALLPLFTLTTIIAALGIGLVAAAISVTYRDFRFVIPFALQALFFATPIIVRHDQFPAWVQTMLWVNPVGGTIGGFRAIVLDQPVDWLGWCVSSAVAAAALLTGLWYFSRVERRFADVI